MVAEVYVAQGPDVSVLNKNLIPNLRPCSYSSLGLQPWEPLALIPLCGKSVVGLPSQE